MIARARSPAVSVARAGGSRRGSAGRQQVDRIDAGAWINFGERRQCRKFRHAAGSFGQLGKNGFADGAVEADRTDRQACLEGTIRERPAQGHAQLAVAAVQRHRLQVARADEDIAPELRIHREIADHLAHRRILGRLVRAWRHPGDREQWKVVGERRQAGEAELRRRHVTNDVDVVQCDPVLEANSCTR